MSTSTRSPRAEPGAPGANVALLGIRHHGPGSARAVRVALDQAPPDVVLIEGPGEADALAALVADPDMRPPVALLAHVIDHPERAAFYPFASFSPEWVALTWAVEHDVPVRFIDLRVQHSLAETGDEQWTLQDASRNDIRTARRDPLGELAAAAGYDDTERWWEDVVEHRGQLHGSAVFEAIADAVTSVRQLDQVGDEPADPVEQRREACMRRGIRTALADGYADIAVVCGAWHVPALAAATDPARARRDARLLTGMAKVKAAITWVPWTNRRLATATGYGAGVAAPGWYHHLFTHPGDDTIVRWFVDVAGVLRAADHPASAADVVEATRLAHALAALRDRPLPGLREVSDAARAALGQGTDTPMRLVSSELVVGRRVGRVPASTPMVPLARDLLAEQRRCRLRADGAPRMIELDVRKPLDLRRSHLMHRLDLLDVPWGREVEGRRSAGTFRETWELRWEPELEIRVIEASPLGTTIATATAVSVVHQARAASALNELTELLDRSLLAALGDVLPTLIDLVADTAALSNDVVHLMEALTPLARTIRYGDVRRTEAQGLAVVVRGMVGRVVSGLTAACTDLDPDAGAAMVGHLRDAHGAIALLGDVTLRDLFDGALLALVDRERVPGIVQGLATRVLADAGHFDGAELERRVARALSAGTAPLDGAAFVEGLLGGAGAALVHDPLLLGVLDRWLTWLDASSFTEVLPLLRRTFGAFEPAERRSIGDRVRSGEAPATHRGAIEIDPQRAAAALHTIGLLLGVEQR